MSNVKANLNSANANALLKKYKEEPNKLTPQQKDKLIMEYAPLIRFIAQKIAVRLPSNIELDDLISSGVIGLMDAIDKNKDKETDKNWFQALKALDGLVYRQNQCAFLLADPGRYPAIKLTP